MIRPAFAPVPTATEAVSPAALMLTVAVPAANPQLTAPSAGAGTATTATTIASNATARQDRVVGDARARAAWRASCTERCRPDADSKTTFHAGARLSCNPNAESAETAWRSADDWLNAATGERASATSRVGHGAVAVAYIVEKRSQRAGSADRPGRVVDQGALQGFRRIGRSIRLVWKSWCPRFESGSRPWRKARICGLFLCGDGGAPRLIGGDSPDELVEGGPVGAVDALLESARRRPSSSSSRRARPGS